MKVSGHRTGTLVATSLLALIACQSPGGKSDSNPLKLGQGHTGYALKDMLDSMRIESGEDLSLSVAIATEVDPRIQVTWKGETNWWGRAIDAGKRVYDGEDGGDIAFDEGKEIAEELTSENRGYIDPARWSSWLNRWTTEYIARNESSVFVIDRDQLDAISTGAEITGGPEALFDPTNQKKLKEYLEQRQFEFDGIIVVELAGIDAGDAKVNFRISARFTDLRPGANRLFVGKDSWVAEVDKNTLLQNPRLEKGVVIAGSDTPSQPTGFGGEQPVEARFIQVPKSLTARSTLPVYLEKEGIWGDELWWEYHVGPVENLPAECSLVPAGATFWLNGVQVIKGPVIKTITHAAAKGRNREPSNDNVVRKHLDAGAKSSGQLDHPAYRYALHCDQMYESIVQPENDRMTYAPLDNWARSLTGKRRSINISEL